MSKILNFNSIYIDTSIWCAYNFDTTNKSLSKIMELCRDDSLVLLVTPILKKEIKSKVKDISDDLAKSIQKIAQKGKAIGISEAKIGCRYLSDFTESNIEKEIINKIDNFFRSSNSRTINIPKSSIDSVFNKYFEKKPPFGPGKKKSEFPDAFCINALEQYATKHNEQVCLISRDGDFSDSCKENYSLVSFKSIEEFLDSYNSSQELSGALHRFIESEYLSISEKTTEEVECHWFFLEDESGDVNEVTVQDIVIDYSLLVDINNNTAVFHLGISALIHADISYEDPELGFYDDEDKTWHSLKTCEAMLEETIYPEVDVTVEFNKGDSDSLKVSDIAVNLELHSGLSVNHCG